MFIMGPKLTQPGPWANDDFADREVFRMDGTPVAAPKRVDIAVQDQFQWTPAAGKKCGMFGIQKCLFSLFRDGESWFQHIPTPFIKAAASLDVPPLVYWLYLDSVVSPLVPPYPLGSTWLMTPKKNVIAHDQHQIVSKIPLDLLQRSDSNASTDGSSISRYPLNQPLMGHQPSLLMFLDIHLGI